MAGAPAHLAVLPLDAIKFARSGRRIPPLLADLVRALRAEAPSSTDALRRRILDRPPAERPAVLESHLQEQLAAVLKLPLSRIELHRPLGSLGLESLTALELRKRLEASLGLRLSATLVWSYPTVAALAQHLTGRLSADAEPGSPTAPRSATPAGAAPGFAAVAELSEEEALRELLAGRGKRA
jgi:acyl carrier protein